jgi:hypothetical protein
MIVRTAITVYFNVTMETNFNFKMTRIGCIYILKVLDNHEKCYNCIYLFCLHDARWNFLLCLLTSIYSLIKKIIISLRRR